MDKLDKMRAFVAVVETGSFAAAGKRLGLSNKVISKGIQALEADIGSTLLFRTTRAMSITPEGRLYLQGCRRVLLEYDMLSASLETSKGLRGSLRIAAPVTFGEVLVTDAVVDFMELHPEIEIDLVLSDAHEDLAEKGFDLAIRIGNLKDSNLRQRTLAQAELIVVASPAYLAEFGTPAQPHDLANHTCIRDTNSDSPNRWPFEGEDGPFSVPVHGRLVCNSSAAGLTAARKSQGLAMVPDVFAERDLVAGRLVQVLSEAASLQVPIQAVYLPSGYGRPKLTAFIDHMKDAVAAGKARCKGARPA
ncbi:LysR substrate-binding domain-containing protein [Algirhabdus cladophorae]|uniref:LysR family transcriptional regulator n=1 Tax=Algirhabdus cladophorae TaxID=3377108 RepID=UPI003B846AB4